MPHRILNEEQVADYLHLHADEIRRLVRRDEIPHERQGARVIFRQKNIDTWASHRLLGMSSRRLEDFHRRSTTRQSSSPGKKAVMAMLLHPSRINATLASKTRSAVLHDIADLANSSGWVNDPVALFESLERREKICSTALPGGVALLHPDAHIPYLFEENFLLLARVPQPIHFGSPDGQPTECFFLLCCRDELLHLHILARLCMMCQHTDLLNRLRTAGDAHALHAAVVTAEESILRMV